MAVADGVASLAYVAGHPRGAATRDVQHWRNVTAWTTGTSPAMTTGAVLDYTNLLCFFAAAMKLAKSGCGSNGRDFNSG